VDEETKQTMRDLGYKEGGNDSTWYRTGSYAAVYKPDRNVTVWKARFSKDQWETFHDPIAAAAWLNVELS